MSVIRRLRVGPRLGGGFAAVILVFLFVVGSSAVTQSRVQQAEAWNVHTYQVLGEADELLRAMVNMETGARGFLLSGKDAYLEPWRQGGESFERHWDEAKKLTADNPEQQRRLDQMKALNAEFVGVVQALVSKRRSVNDDGLAAFAAEFAQGADKKSMDAFRALEAEFAKAESVLLDQRQAQAQRQRSLNNWVTAGGTALALALAVVASLAITRSIVQPLGEALRAANTVAEGDLRWHTCSDAADEPGELLHALQRMNDSLVRVVGAVRMSSDHIATASSQIASGNADLSQRTEEQASNLQQTAASMEQLTGTVNNNADAARQASQLASSASQVAAEGGEVVGRVVSTMDEIRSSSSRIADIISVIDGIAFQTNILALNAAVEAARAGEQGRGFAVVAGEVRNLAQRSAQAAKEIKSLIAESVEKVAAGSDLVGRAGQTMGDIVAQVQRVTDLIAEISAATQEQTTGIGQVGSAVGQLDQMTQQNAALVEQSAAASESLKQQAAQLVRAVSQFKLDQDSATGPSRSAARVAAPPAARRAAPVTEAVAMAAAARGGDDWQSF